MITTRLKAGHEGDLPLDRRAAGGRATRFGSGAVDGDQDQNDPSKVDTVVVFESGAAARARENDPRRQEGLQAARATMVEIFDGAPEFVDLTVVEDFTP